MEYYAKKAPLYVKFTLYLWVQAGVYEGAVHLDELSILLRRSFLNSYREYWEQRLEKERVERVRQAKQQWESQCQASIGL
ncbi:probable E3 ubiquitin-protein ligase BAH1-like 1 [Gossypium hirsutum]|uniref:Probable E3 ubiquitin-protein ligase BAH1-like 1 n=1 Tax=Gossypium hirsutum TaxID=3635 RepID=A0ABM3B4J2_GOSHI|nr:probable E3 ubiquitin-protein ligase BAH1-like 1 [Gossypium hirsutum]